MLYKIGKYKFNSGSKRGIKRLDNLTLQDLDSEHEHVFPKGKILIKKADYALLRVKRSEPIVKRMLSILGARDTSTEFILLYVNHSYAGYKSKKGIKFIPNFRNKNYTKILEDYH